MCGSVGMRKREAKLERSAEWQEGGDRHERGSKMVGKEVREEGMGRRSRDGGRGR